MAGRALGVDLSHWQAKVDFETLVKTGIKFVFIKASEGAAGVDENFSMYWQAAGAAGLLRGAYHFFRPDFNPTVQAQFFYDTLMDAGSIGELPPVLDVEKRPLVAAQIKPCLDAIERIFGKHPIIYTAPGLWNEMGAVPWAKDYSLWVAQYPYRDWSDDLPNRLLTGEPRLPRDWSTWLFWQFTERGPGRRMGVGSSRLDINFFRGDTNELLAYTGLTPAAAAAPAPVPAPVAAPTPAPAAVPVAPARPLPPTAPRPAYTPLVSTPLVSTPPVPAPRPAAPAYVPPSRPAAPPSIPSLPRARVLPATINIRSAPQVLTGNVRSSLRQGETPEVIEVRMEGANIWLRIGWEQWVAMRYNNSIYLEWA